MFEQRRARSEAPLNLHNAENKNKKKRKNNSSENVLEMASLAGKKKTKDEDFSTDRTCLHLESKHSGYSANLKYILQEIERLESAETLLSKAF